MHASFYINNFGCVSVGADGERIGRFFKEHGFSPSTLDDADIVVVMACGFTTFHQQKTIEGTLALRAGMKPTAQLWVSGCLPKINPRLLSKVKPDKLFGPREVEKVLENTAASWASDRGSESTPVDSNKGPNKVYPLRIATGCMDRCSYCTIRRATGIIRSRSVEKIVLEAEAATRQGAYVLQLVGEDMGCYGVDIGSSIFSLVEALTQHLPEIKLYLASIHPRYFIEEVDQYVRLFTKEEVGLRVSLPVQSGADRILRLMKRDYDIAELRKTLDSFLGAVPKARLATDLIVGFPTETDDEFELTRQLLRDYPFHFVDVFKYDDQPGTAAFSIQPKVPEVEKERRLRILSLDVVSLHLQRNGIINANKIRGFLGNSAEVVPLNVNADFRRRSENAEAEY